MIARQSPDYPVEGFSEMTKTMRACLLTAAATALTVPALAQELGPDSVRSGIAAWQAGQHEEAVRLWRPLADRGDADAQYNMAQAYFLGRGVPRNANLAEQWYERSARQGHEDAQAALGLILFQNGRRREAMPWIERSANRGDPRAQYVLGTALFNGDIVARDAARAYALMTRAAASGLPPAVSQLAAMEPHVTDEERARATEIARSLPSAPRPIELASATPSPPPPSPPAPARATPRTQAQAQPRVQQPAPRPPAQTAPRPAAPALASAGGRWRIQLGAFSSEVNARRAWGAVAGRLPGLQPNYVRAGAVVRLQAGPLRDRAAAQQACARAGGGCFAVAP
jgi:cell division septation protein DedD